MNNTIFGDVTTTPIPMGGGAANLDDCANAIKKSVSGKSITLTDVSPIAHKCSCRLTSDTYEEVSGGSKNIIDWANADTSMFGYDCDGVDYVVNEDGSYTFTPTRIPDGEEEWNNLGSEVSVEYTFNPNKKYTISIKNDKDYDFYKYGISIDEIKGDYETYIYDVYNVYDNAPTTKSYTYTFPNEDYPVLPDAKVNVFAYFAIENITEPVTVYIQIEEGTEATEWEPYSTAGEMITKPYITDFREVEVLVNGGADGSYTPTEDGTVEGIESVSPNMEISILYPNANVKNKANICDFTHCVDTKSYVDADITDEWQTIVDITLDETNGDVNSIGMQMPEETVKAIKQCKELMCLVEFTAKYAYAANRVIVRGYLSNLKIPLIYTSNGSLSVGSKARALSRILLSECGNFSHTAQLTQHDLFNSATSGGDYICQTFDNIKDKDNYSWFDLTLTFSSSQTETQTFGAGAHFKLVGRK